MARMVVTEDMHERKKVMFMNSDAVVVVLPGGAESLDEFFEVLTWRAQIGLRRSCCWMRMATGSPCCGFWIM